MRLLWAMRMHAPEMCGLVACSTSAAQQQHSSSMPCMMTGPGLHCGLPDQKSSSVAVLQQVSALLIGRV